MIKLHIEPKPVWIIGHSRTGSTLLCEILNNSRKFNPCFAEWLNHEWINSFVKNTKEYQYVYRNWACKRQKSNIQDVFKQKTENLIKLLPPYIKCGRYHFNLFFKNSDKEMIENHFSGIRYIHLRRRDLIAAAVSNHIGHNTKIYRITNEEELLNHAAKQVPVHVEGLRKIYNAMKRYEKDWTSYVGNTDCLEVFYEDLCDEPYETVETILDFLKLPVNPDQLIPSIKSIKMQHPQTPELYRLLQNDLKNNLQNR